MFTIFTKIVKFFLDLFDLTLLIIVAILCKKDLKDFFEWLMEFKLGLKEYIPYKEGGHNEQPK